MDQVEKLAELGKKLANLQNNATTLSDAEKAKQIKNIELELSEIKDDEKKTGDKHGVDENSMTGDLLKQISIADNSKIGDNAPGSRSHGWY